jgi:hypothetical protein
LQELILTGQDAAKSADAQNAEDVPDGAEVPEAAASNADTEGATGDSSIDASDRGEYLERVFGTAGYSVVRRPEQLPAALSDLVRQLLRGGGR